VKARARADSTRGPGHAVLELTDLPAPVELAGARLGFRRGDGRTLGAAGWQVGDALLPAPAGEWRDGIARLPIGPEIVDHMAAENIQLTLRLADGATHGAVFPWGTIAKSPAGGRRGGVGSAPVPAAPTGPTPAPVAVEPLAAPPVASERPAAGRLGPWVAAAMVALLVLGLVAYQFWPPLIGESTPPPVAQQEGTPPASPPPRAESAPAPSPPAVPPAAEPPPAPAPSTPPPAPLPPREQAQAALRSGIAPEAALPLARDLAAVPGGADAAFLLYEDAAQKGSAEGALAAGGYFDPVEPSGGATVTKDPAQAWRYYRQARDGGAPDAEARLARLRQWVEAEAARGVEAAKELLAKW
jgi:hypothetical protein